MKKFEELEAMQKKKAAQAKVFLQMVNNDQINGDGDGSMENGVGSVQAFYPSGELNEDELRELYTKIGSVLDSDDGNDESLLAADVINQRFWGQ